MEKVIDGVSIEQWKEAFAICLANAFRYDNFSDLLFYDLYPNTSEEAGPLGKMKKPFIRFIIQNGIVPTKLFLKYLAENFLLKL